MIILAQYLDSFRALRWDSSEQLGSIQVTPVAKRPERLADAAASVFVITGDDIRRSGATTLPEALRLAPNLQVARAMQASIITWSNRSKLTRFGRC